MLKQVVLTGTGRRAQLNGYTAAGKTGTAWKFDAKTRSIDSSKYISSFIGMAPSDDPRVVIAVVIDEPKTGARDGGMVAAPVFREIAQNMLQEMKVPNDAAVKPETNIAADIPESAAKKADNKKTAAAKPEGDKNSKTVAAASVKGKDKDKDKSKDQKRTNGKAPAQKGRSVATLIRKAERLEIERIETTEIET
jgi:cell division protein FtsI (penicillin-binding protein 3)